MSQRGLGEVMGELRDASIRALRAADVLLRCGGGRQVFLRLPAPASSGDTTEQLGLGVPVFQDVALEPVVFRKARATFAEGKAAMSELLVSGYGCECGGWVDGVFGGECSVCYGVWSVDR
jgi:hypothetical protein